MYDVLGFSNERTQSSCSSFFYMSLIPSVSPPFIKLSASGAAIPKSFKLGMDVSSSSGAFFPNGGIFSGISKGRFGNSSALKCLQKVL